MKLFVICVYQGIEEFTKHGTKPEFRTEVGKLIKDLLIFGYYVVITIYQTFLLNFFY